ncbi:MAG: hypothetical protein NTV21_04855 [Planctomycetota bacterium]|nr:hypothetical protein [Planctomycetota bacterium]
MLAVLIACLCAFVAQDSPEKQAPAVTTPAATPFEVQRLRTGADELETRHGLALVRATAGHLGEAAKRLVELAPLAKDAAAKDLLERDRARLVALDGVRTAILKERIATAKKLQFSLPDRKLLVSVRAIDGDWLLLGENRQGLERLPLSDFSLELLAKELPNPAPEAWMKPYLQLLAADPRAAKANLEGAKLADLRADALQVSDRLRRGIVASELEALADRGLPRDETSARDAADALRRLLERHKDSVVIATRRVALREYALAVIATSFSASSVPQLFGGKCEPLPDGQLRWTVDFEKPEDATLFTPSEELWPSYRTELLEDSQPTDTRLEQRPGALAIHGSGSWLAPAMFREISSASARGQHTYSSNDKSVILYLLVACKGPENFIAFTATGDLITLDDATASSRMSLNTIQVSEGRYYEARLERARGELTVAYGGERVSKVPDEFPSWGRVGFFAHHDREFLLDQLSVTGFPDLERLRTFFAERELAKLGL